MRISRSCEILTHSGRGYGPSPDENAIVSHHESPQQTLDATIRRERVQSAIDSLSETIRLPCVLYYFSGFSQAQISETLGLSLNVVKKCIRRARNQLKMEMTDMIRDAMGPDLPSHDSELLSRISLATSFENAARLGQLELIEAMLVDGIDIDETDIKGRTLLHWAGHTGHMEAVQLLLKCGADTTVTDRIGKHINRGDDTRMERRMICSSDRDARGE
jgi:hypothetical protein